MRYPKFLEKGEKIGFIAPSFGCVQEPYNELFLSALNNFKNKGYETVLGPNCLLEEGVGKSNTPEKCADEANDFFINDKSDVIISCGGGETMCEDLTFMDFESISKAKPKWYMGYSDNTNFTLPLATQCDTASIYGPCAASFGLVSNYTSDAFDLITGKKFKFSNYDKWYLEAKLCDKDIEEIEESQGIEIINDKEYIVMPYEQTIYLGNEKSRSAQFSGRLIGGCLDCVTNLVGTGYADVNDFNEKYKEDGIIWFLEACDLNVMSIRRGLWQLKEAGWFKYVKGFLIGRPLHYYDAFGELDRIGAVTSVLSEYGVPIVMDIDLGHLSPAIPIVSGAIGKVTAKDNSFEIEYELK